MEKSITSSKAAAMFFIAVIASCAPFSSARLVEVPDSSPATVEMELCHVDADCKLTKCDLIGTRVQCIRNLCVCIVDDTEGSPASSPPGLEEVLDSSRAQENMIVEDSPSPAPFICMTDEDCKLLKCPVGTAICFDLKCRCPLIEVSN